MNFTLIGMSNIGKSHLARRLETEKPFTVIDCDADTIVRLGVIGQSSLTQLACWLGTPDSKRYKENIRQYMDAEQNVMDKIITGLDPAANRIIDTSGSVIYVRENTKHALKEATRILHLEPPADHKDVMFRQYLSVPKPLIWPNYNAGPMTAFNRAAVKDAYYELMEDRLKQYRALAHVNIPYDVHRHPAFAASDMLKPVF